MPQEAVNSAEEFLEPREGRQIEVGVKQTLFGGAALATLAVFDIEDSNRAVADPDDDTGDYSVASGKVRSRGFEAEPTGRVTEKLDVILGYAYLDTKFDSDPEAEGQVFGPRALRNSGRIWGKYSFADGRLAGLSLGGGLRAQSATFRVVDGVRYQGAGYAVADLLAEYEIRENVTARLLMNNVFDKTYYQSIGYDSRQNYYGEPRAFTFGLSATF